MLSDEHLRLLQRISDESGETLTLTISPNDKGAQAFEALWQSLDLETRELTFAIPEYVSTGKAFSFANEPYDTPLHSTRAITNACQEGKIKAKKETSLWHICPRSFVLWLHEIPDPRIQ